MSDSEVETFCPNCDSRVSILARFCPHCGGKFDTSRKRRGINELIWVGLLCFLLVVPTAICVDIAFNPPHSLRAIIVTVVICSFGMFPTTLGVILTCYDLREIRAGRLNPERRTGTRVGLLACGITLLLYCGVLTFYTVRLF